MLGISGTWQEVIPALLGNPGPPWALFKHNHVSPRFQSPRVHCKGHRDIFQSPDTAWWPFDGPKKRSKNSLWVVLLILLIPAIAGLWVMLGSAAGAVLAPWVLFGVSWTPGMSPRWLSLLCRVTEPCWDLSPVTRAGCAPAKASGSCCSAGARIYPALGLPEAPSELNFPLLPAPVPGVCLNKAK